MGRTEHIHEELQHGESLQDSVRINLSPAHCAGDLHQACDEGADHAEDGKDDNTDNYDDDANDYNDDNADNYDDDADNYDDDADDGDETLASAAAVTGCPPLIPSQTPVRIPDCYDQHIIIIEFFTLDVTTPNTFPYIQMFLYGYLTKVEQSHPHH